MIKLPLIKKNYQFITIIALIVLLSGIIIGKISLKEQYIVYHGYTTREDSLDYEYSQIFGLKNKNKEKKINTWLGEIYNDWHSSSGKNGCFSDEIPLVKFQSIDYLSIELNCYKYDEHELVEKKKCLSYITNVDINRGKVIYLNDILEVNNELISLIKHEGILENADSVSDKYIQNITLAFDKMSVDEILSKLNECSEEFSADNYIQKTLFYFEDNKINFIFFNEDCENKIISIKLNKIEKFLKVKEW